MPSKDELVQRYNRMNTIPQVLFVSCPWSTEAEPFLWDKFRLQGWMGKQWQWWDGWFKDHFEGIRYVLR